MKRLAMTACALTVMAGVSVGAQACSSGGDNATDKIRHWQQATTDDPGFQAIDAELTGDGFDLSDCDLIVNDAKAFADHHPKAPYGEDHWQKALDNLSWEVQSTCEGDLDSASTYESVAWAELTAAQDAMTAALHGKPMPTVW